MGTRRASKNGPDPRVFPGQLRAWRERRGFPDAASFARHLGVPASTITRLERGERTPSLAILCRISAALDVQLDYLVRATACDARPRARAEDGREYEHIRRKLLALTEQLGRGDLRGGQRVMRELGVWLDHLTNRLRRRLVPRTAKVRRNRYG